jgi:hypothetical protein
VIERVFGVFKMRFPVLVNPVSYSIEFQSNLVIALAVVHNFIRIHGGSGDLIEVEAEDEIRRQQKVMEGDNDDQLSTTEANVESPTAKALRDGIANAMWEQYQETLRRRQ